MCAKPLWLLNDTGPGGKVAGMTRNTLILCAALALIALPGLAGAACTVEYKAKQDDPLRLTVGTLEVASCDRAAAEAEARAVLAQRGWTLLKVLSVTG